MVYSTCSFNPLEDEAVVAEVRFPILVLHKAQVRSCFLQLADSEAFTSLFAIAFDQK